MTISPAQALRSALAVALLVATVPGTASDIVTRNVRCYGLIPAEPEPKPEDASAKADEARTGKAAREPSKPKPKRKAYRSMTTAACAAAGGNLGPNR